MIGTIVTNARIWADLELSSDAVLTTSGHACAEFALT